MGLFQALALEALSGYFPTLDLDSLRLNLRRGRLDLNDVELNPGHIFATAGFPFRVTRGFVQKLGLHVPWNLLYSAPVQLDAHGIEIHVEEVAFPSMQTQVFDAFKAEVRRLKYRTLAEGERAESAITRALQKFLPMLLDRVEANISDLTVYIHFADRRRATASITLSKFSTTSNTMGRGLSNPKPRRDLSKMIVAGGISVRLTLDDRPVFEMQRGGFVIHLAMTDGAYAVGIDFREPIRLDVDLEIVSFAKEAKRRAAVWATAFQFGRPTLLVVRDVRAWFRYAVAVVLGRTGRSRTALTMEKYREVMASCVEYRRLHVSRLRKKEALRKEDEEKIEVLEDELDAGMILFLRARARADVLAEEVSAFATKDWLSWALFGYKMSEEREHLAMEIRKSLLVAEQSEQDEVESAASSSSASDAGALSRGWTKANISFTLAMIFVRLARQGDELGTVSIKKFDVQAEIDSSMQSYSMSSKLVEFLITDGDRNVLCQERPEALTNLPAESFLEAKLFKPAVDNVIKLEVRIAPSVVLLDIERMSRYVEAIRYLQGIQRSPPEVGGETLCQTEYSMPATVPSTSSLRKSNRVQLSLSADFPELRICMTNEKAPLLKGSDKLFRLVFCVREIQLEAQNALNVPQIQASCTATLSVCSEYSSYHGSSYHDEPATGFESASGTLPPFLLGTKATFEVLENHVSLTLERVNGHVVISKLNNVWIGVSENVRALHNGLRAIANEKSLHGRRHSVSIVDKDPVTLEPFHLDVTSMNFSIHRDESEAHGTILLSTGDLQAVVSASAISFTLADEVSLTESKYGGKLLISRVPVLDYTLKADVVQSAQGVTSSLDLMGAHLSLVANPDTIVEVISSLRSCRMLICNFLPSPRNDCSPSDCSDHTFSQPNAEPTQVSVVDCSPSDCSDHTFSQPNAEPTQVSVVLNTVELVPTYRESRVLLRFRNAHYVVRGDIISGSLDVPELIDKSGLSGYHDVAIQSAAQTTSMPKDERSLTFNITSNSVSIHAFALQITVLRSLVERLMGLVQAFADTLSLVEQHPMPHGEEKAAELHASPPGRKVICVQGSGLSIRFPRSAHHSDAVAFDTNQLTMTISVGSVAISIRKLNVLTRTRKCDSVLVDPSTSISAAENDAEWIVLVRGLDLDISQNSKDTSVGSELVRQIRSELNIQLLSKAILFLSPSQVRLFKALHNSLQGGISNQAGIEAENASQERKPADIPFFSLKDHAVFKMETQVISVELINEDRDGSVVSTIAGFEVDPIRINQKALREESKPENVTKVSHWTLESFKLSLCDKASEVPPQLREVIRNGDGGRRYFSRPLDDSLRSKPCLFIESVARVDRNGKLKSSLDIRLHNLLIVPSPALHQKLVLFFRQCSSSSEDERREHEPDVASPQSRIARRDSAPARFRTDHMQSSSAMESEDLPQDDHDPLRKVSISMNDSFIQVFGRGRRVGESSILIHTDLIKAAFLFDRNSDLLRGSQIRVRNASFSTTWLPSTTVKAERALNGLAEQLGTRRNNQNVTSERSSLRVAKRSPFENDFGSSWRHSLAVPREKFRWDLFRQANETHSSENVAFIRNAVLRFPVQESDRLVIAVSSLSIDARIRLILRFAYILSVANLLPTMEDDQELSLPPIQVAVNNVSINVQTPFASERNSPDPDPGNQAIIRIRATINGLVAKNLSAMSGSLKITADVVDKKSGIRDQIISPSILDFEAHGVETLSLSFSAGRLVRVVISPLTARAITSIILNVLPVPGSSYAPKNGGVKSIEVGFLNADESGLQQLRISFSLRGVVLCCIAEEPRVQLLRLVLRHIESEVSLPLTTNGIGAISFSLQDVILEDTISWRLYAHEVSEDGSRWSNIFAGTEGIPGSGVISRMPSRKLLLESMKTLLIGSTEATDSQTHTSDDRGDDSGPEPSQQSLPLLRCTASWQSPLDHISAHIQLRGIELNLNMSILPGLVEWIESVKQAAKEVRDAHLKKFSSPSTASQSRGSESSMRIGIDHLVIEPFQISISAKAPPRRIQETAIRRSLMWLFGSEQVLGLTLQTPPVVFNGDFDTPERLLQRLRTIYVSSLSSQRVSRQLFWQAPGFVQLARVAVTSVLRRRHSGYSFLSSSSLASSSPRRQGPGYHAPLGLVEAITDVEVGASTHVRLMPTTASGLTDKATIGEGPQEQAEKGIETLDITSIVDSPEVP